MSDVAIRVEGLGKQYRIGGPQARYKTLRESLVGAARAPIRRAGRLLRGEAATDNQETIWALKDVSFEVKHGEVLGIIGRNGAGKSTLLKVLSRITTPTEGTVDLYGRVGSLLEVGTGFHPELTGRENIYLNGAILGMKRVEIDQKFDEIVAFAELEKFLDTPVKHYSSGMYVRLAFAVAAHLDPEILLVDEVLAVGDLAFQKKCLGKMGEVAGEGRTVLFVSHNMAAIQHLCDKAILLDFGRCSAYADTGRVIEHYMESGLSDYGTRVSLRDHPNRRRTCGIALQEMALFVEGVPANSVGMGECIEIVLTVDSEQPIHNIGLAVEDVLGRRLFIASPRYQQPELLRTPVKRAKIACSIPGLRLLPGRYYIETNVSSGTSEIDRIERAGSFIVVERDVFNTGVCPAEGKGVFYADAIWAVEIE